jgi:drug/metabolite transporter (DMT)-like permease
MSAATNRPAARGFTWADAGILLTVLIWGGNMVVVKAALSEIPPLAFTALRFIGAAVIETIVLHAMGENLQMPWRDMRRTLAMALFGVVAYQGLFVLGIARTTAGNASVLLATIPILVALYNGIFKRQKLGANVWLGIALTIAGSLALTLGRGQLLRAEWGTLLGDLLIIIASIGWTIYTVGAQSLMQTYSPLKLTTLSMVITAPILLLLALPGFLNTDWGRVSPASWAGLAYSGLFGIALAYLLWNVSVKRLGDTRTAVYSNLTPIVSLVAAWFFLGERLNLLQFAGAVIVLVGVSLARFSFGRRPALKES